MRLFFAAMLLLLSGSASAQKIYGIVYNDQGDLLPFASVTVKGTSIGTSANNKASFSITLSPGSYTLVCQHIGYTAKEKVIELSVDTEVTFILSPQKLVLKEVVISTGAEDPAYAIIREAIKKRPYYNKQVNAFSCDIYSKDLIKLRRLPKKMFGQKIKEEDKQDMGLDSAGKGILYLSESISKVHKQGADKFKMEVLSSRVSGSGGFGFSFPAFISLYNSNVTIFTERFNPRGFISPIADGAIGFYKFKFLGSFFEDGKEINSIRVTPRRSYEPLFSGIINITEGDWRIHSFDLMLTKTSHLEILDTLQISQLHVPVGEDIWRTKNQRLYFNLKLFGIDAIGNFLSVYSNYNLKPGFDKKFFDRIVISYDTAVNKRSVAYWDSARAVPLEPEELKDYRVKDSIYKVNKDSAMSRVHIDSLNKRQGKVKILPVIWSGIHRTHYSIKNQYSWGVSPLLFNSEYNTVEGFAVNVNPYFTRSMGNKRTEMSFEPTFRYGFNNGHFNPSARLIFTTRDNKPGRKLQSTELIFSGGKRVSDFNKESQIHPIANTFRTLVSGQNYTKIYENYFGSIQFGKRYESGLSLNIKAEYEDRIPLDNTTTYTFRKKDSIHITPNYPFLKIPSQFSPHQSFQVSVNVSFKPGQRYIQLPHTKIAIGSKYPTFRLNYTKAFTGIFGSDADFDKWKFSVGDDKNLKLAGTFMYNVGVGGFINRKKVFIQDYQHFNRGMGVLNSFQLADFYAHSTTAPFYLFGHVEHHFNGLVTNKIPLFKRLNWNLVAGSNTFFVNDNEYYAEIFAGLENIFKIFRVDAIAGYTPGKDVQTGIRLSSGGILGARSAGVSKRGNSINLSF